MTNREEYGDNSHIVFQLRDALKEIDEFYDIISHPKRFSPVADSWCIVNYRIADEAILSFRVLEIWHTIGTNLMGSQSLLYIPPNTVLAMREMPLTVDLIVEYIKHYHEILMMRKHNERYNEST